MSVPYENLVIGGGGGKGYIMLGILNKLISKDVIKIDDVTTFAGTSIGSVICLLLCCGMTPFEIFYKLYFEEIKIDTNFNLSFDTVSNFTESYGILDIKKTLAPHLEKLVCEYLKLDSSPTFAELYKLTGKTLRVCATDITQEKECMFSPLTTPEVNCIDGVCASCNIPFVFEKVMIGDSIYADGGLVNNFPIDYVDEMTKTVAIAVPSSGESSPSTSNLLGYMFRVFNTPNKLSTRCKLENITPSTLLIKGEWDASSSVSLKMSPEEKKEMWKYGEKLADEVTSSI